MIAASDATVVLAAHDLGRWPLLVAAIESLLAEADQPGRIVLCVDHNTQLHLRASVAWPQVTTIPNDRSPGASAARNCGAELATTPFIAFTDDDVTIRPGWLPRLLAPLADPAVVGTGGGVTARWPGGRPSWFPEEFDWVVGASYRGMPTSRADVRNVWSENMAVRAAAFRAVGGFREGFGKLGNTSRPEDTDLCIRLAAGAGGGTGGRWVYVPDALVQHHVPPERASMRFFLRRSFQEGAGKVEMARLLACQEEARQEGARQAGGREERGRQGRLATERDYLRRTLPAGIRAGIAASAARREPAGLLRAAAIVGGVAAAGAGAVIATGRRRPAGSQCAGTPS